MLIYCCCVYEMYKTVQVDLHFQLLSAVSRNSTRKKELATSGHLRPCMLNCQLLTNTYLGFWSLAFVCVTGCIVLAALQMVQVV